jgi:phosphoribosylformylglycinamidine (FGAM) synthase PurS component
VIVEAVVTRKTKDLVRDAAEDLLRDSAVGFERVERAELWSFEVEAESASPEIRKILDETTLVVNPNVHRYSLKTWETRPSSGCRLFVRVKDRVDAKGASVTRSIRGRLKIESIREAARSVLWTIDLGTSDRAEAERLGRDVAGLGPRGAGLLANPHSQEVEIRVAAA